MSRSPRPQLYPFPAGRPEGGVRDAAGTGLSSYGGSLSNTD
ncbi:hypothetical protein [Azospirillum argentinense]